jgi:hypothetical protein
LDALILRGIVELQPLPIRGSLMTRLHALAASIAFAAWPALAQQANPAAAGQGPAATPVPAAALAKHSCGAKPDHPGKLASDNMKRAWQRDATTYLECLRKFATDQQQVAQDSIKAANAAVDEYNAAVKEFNDAAKAASAN